MSTSKRGSSPAKSTAAKQRQPKYRRTYEQIEWLEKRPAFAIQKYGVDCAEADDLRMRIMHATWAVPPLPTRTEPNKA